jgi:tRNA pseudouridine55 synthase
MLIIVDKPIWISSFDVIRVLKRELWEKKIWHSWTLDPMASW